MVCGGWTGVFCEPRQMGPQRCPAGCCATLREATSSRRAAELTLQLSVFEPPALLQAMELKPLLPPRNPPPSPEALCCPPPSSPVQVGKTLQPCAIYGRGNCFFLSNEVLTNLTFCNQAMLSYFIFMWPDWWQSICSWNIFIDNLFLIK